MELSDFIQTPLREILKGVRAAAGEDIAVAPAYIEGKPVFTERLVSFEVHVTTDIAGKSGIKVMQIVEAGGEMKRTNTNRISFSVPIHMNVKKEKT